MIKPKLDWDKHENEASKNNVRAMYSIFNSINTDEFSRIATCISTKEAWDILRAAHERPTSRFQTFRMEDHETYGEFHANNMDIANSR